MTQNTQTLARYVAASDAMHQRMGDPGPGLSVPLSPEIVTVVKEYVAAATAYADDLEANGHAVPHDLRTQIEHARQLLG